MEVQKSVFEKTVKYFVLVDRTYIILSNTDLIWDTAFFAICKAVFICLLCVSFSFTNYCKKS